jgi:hypothetical protein
VKKESGSVSRDGFVECEQRREASRLLTEQEAAAYLAVSPATLRSWRCRGIGPAYIKLGSGPKAACRYNLGDLEEYIQGHRQVASVQAARN